MTEAEISRSADGILHVSGALTFNSIPRLFEQGRELLSELSRPVIDLQGVTRTNSAGLLLLLEWLSEGQRREQQIHFRHIPDSIKNIAKVSNVLGLLPEATDAPPPTAEVEGKSHTRRPKVKARRRRKKR